MNGTDWPHLRTLHLPGGLRVYETRPGEALLYPTQNTSLLFLYEKYASLPRAIQKNVNIPALGLELRDYPSESNTHFPPKWIGSTSTKDRQWTVELIDRQFSGLSFASKQVNDTRTRLIASCVSVQVRHANFSLRAISSWYNCILRGLLRSDDDFLEESIYNGGYLDPVYSSIHSAFSEIATFRDYIAEFIAHAAHAKSIDNMNGLVQYLQSNNISDPISLELRNANAENGWMKAFSLLRNTFLHRLPLSLSANGGFCLLKKATLPDSSDIYMLHIPCPDPIVDRSARSTSMFEPAKLNTPENAVAFYSTLQGQQDVMEFLFRSFHQMLLIACNSMSLFPYEPQFVRITDEDIIDVRLK